MPRRKFQPFGSSKKPELQILGMVILIAWKLFKFTVRLLQHGVTRLYLHLRRKNQQRQLSKLSDEWVALSCFISSGACVTEADKVCNDISLSLVAGGRIDQPVEEAAKNIIRDSKAKTAKFAERLLTH